MAGETRNRLEDCERTPLLSQSKSSKEVTGNGKRQRARKETSTCTILSIYFLCVTFLCVLAFAFGWTPCIGPQLGAILSLAAQEASVMRGTILLAVYALGLGVPFLLVAVFLSRLGGVLTWMKRHMEQIEKLMGLLLWTIGLLMLTGGFSAISFWLLENFPALATLG